MVLKVYISGMSGNKEVKKRQQRVLMILDSKQIKYDLVDITEPGKEYEKELMQEKSNKRGGTISDPNPRHPLPPQLFYDSEYCGDYDEFDLANEVDTLEQFLKLAPTEITSVSTAQIELKKSTPETSEAASENGEKPAEEVPAENGDSENKENGDELKEIINDAEDKKSVAAEDKKEKIDETKDFPDGKDTDEADNETTDQVDGKIEEDTLEEETLPNTNDDVDKFEIDGKESSEVKSDENVNHQIKDSVPLDVNEKINEIKNTELTSEIIADKSDDEVEEIVTNQSKEEAKTFFFESETDGEVNSTDNLKKESGLQNATKENEANDVFESNEILSEKNEITLNDFDKDSGIIENVENGNNSEADIPATIENINSHETVKKNDDDLASVFTNSPVSLDTHTTEHTINEDAEIDVKAKIDERSLTSTDDSAVDTFVIDSSNDTKVEETKIAPEINNPKESKNTNGTTEIIDSSVLSANTLTDSDKLA